MFAGNGWCICEVWGEEGGRRREAERICFEVCLLMVLSYMTYQLLQVAMLTVLIVAAFYVMARLTALP